MSKDIETLLNSPDVFTRELSHDTVSVNFKKNVFYDGTWDGLNIKARGLFVRKNTNEIVARSYDKFFNLDERPETFLRNIEKQITPETEISAYFKENGFLGILCFDQQIQGFRYFSKSTEESKYALIFKGILEPIVEKNREFLQILLNGRSMVFEVEDPVEDPHIIEYGSKRVVLLDIVNNTYEFSKCSYELLTVCAKEIGVACKAKWHWASLVSSASLKEKVEVAKKMPQVEGFVFELKNDNKVFMFKIKTEFYIFWKLVRTARDRLLKDKLLTDNSIKELFKKANLSKEEIDCSVIELRKKLTKHL